MALPTLFAIPRNVDRAIKWALRVDPIPRGGKAFTLQELQDFTHPQLQELLVARRMKTRIVGGDRLVKDMCVARLDAFENEPEQCNVDWFVTPFLADAWYTFLKSILAPAFGILLV